jgi:hypothetical protein
MGYVENFIYGCMSVSIGLKSKLAKTFWKKCPLPNSVTQFVGYMQKSIYGHMQSKFIRDQYG